jgi:hypothetical protein
MDLVRYIAYMDIKRDSKGVLFLLRYKKLERVLWKKLSSLTIEVLYER